MERLIIIRHGKTEANSRYLYCGATDVPLSEDGVAELKLLKDSASYPDTSGFSYYTSGMIRAEQTLEILFGPVIHSTLADFCEMNFGSFEMKSYYELQENAEFQRWFNGAKEVSTPNGESSEEFEERVLRGLEKIRFENNVLLVCHGGTISRIMRHYFPALNRDRYAWQPSSGSGYEILFHDHIAKEFRVIPILNSD